MKPGRELDVLVAVHAMNYTNIRTVDSSHVSGLQYFGTTTDEFGWPVEVSIPAFSTDIAAALTVVEKIEKPFEVSCDDEHSLWNARFDLDRGEWKQATTAPHAIALAALKSVGAE